MTAEHSILAPSSAARRVACPGSRFMEAQYPTEDSESSREGKAAHWVAATALEFGEAKARACQYTSAGEPITEEMIEGAILYANAAKRIVQHERLKHERWHVEEKLSIRSVHPECWGTPDAWIGDASVELHVFDYKFGHRYIEVFENWQLIAYAAGALKAIQIYPYEVPPDFKIHMTIVQPRSYHPTGHVNTWTATYEQLKSYIEQLRVAEFTAMQPTAPCNPNPECSFCSARHACTALRQSTLTAVDISTLNTPDELTNESLGSELRYLKRAHKLLDARITGLEAQALAKLKSGERVPDFRLEQSSGRTRWKTPEEEVVILGQLYGVDLAKPLTAITPNQAEKKGIPRSLINQMTETPRGALKLVEDNTRKIFGGLNT